MWIKWSVPYDFVRWRWFCLSSRVCIVDLVLFWLPIWTKCWNQLPLHQTRRFRCSDLGLFPFFYTFVVGIRGYEKSHSWVRFDAISGSIKTIPFYSIECSVMYIIPSYYKHQLGTRSILSSESTRMIICFRSVGILDPARLSSSSWFRSRELGKYRREVEPSGGNNTQRFAKLFQDIFGIRRREIWTRSSMNGSWLLLAIIVDLHRGLVFPGIY